MDDLISRRAELAEIQQKVRLYLNVGRFDAAEKLLRAALADHGDLANLHNLLGLTFHRQSKFHEALVAFKQSLRANPAFAEAALNLAATLCDLSRYDEADVVFSAINAQINPRKRQPSLVLGRLADRHAKNGRLYEESGMPAEAIQEYRRALSLYERLPDVKLALAKLYLRAGQNEKAQQELEETVRLAPETPHARTWLGILYFKQGQKTLAKQQWEKARQLDPNDLTARAYLKISAYWPNGPTA